jgi:hypothetical protein
MLIFELDPGPVRSSQEAARACEQLYLDLKMNAPEADIAKRQTPEVAEHREFVTLLTTLVATGVKLGVFAGLFNVLKAWLANRPKAEVTITYPDGSSLKVSNATLDQALKLLDRQNSGKK